MAYPIEKKLVIAVASSAVFDLRRSNDVFILKGEEEYRKHQRERLDVPFETGVAYPFIRRLLSLNRLYPKEEPVEVIVLSKNDPETGRRFFRSCRYFGLAITRGAFVTGKAPHQWIPAFNASLFLSANERDVVAAIGAGYAAGVVLPAVIKDDDTDMELRVAFDFDGVVADDAAERIYQKTNLETFHESEQTNMLQPHAPGPLKDLLSKMAFFQKLEAKKAKEDAGYKPALRIAIITARNAPSNERFVTTLNSWGISADETFFLGGIEKKRILDVLKPHIFFDDQIAHLRPTFQTIPSVHIPFGLINQPAKSAIEMGNKRNSRDEKVGMVVLPPC
jgi:5'-nucleotidase